MDHSVIYPLLVLNLTTKPILCPQLQKDTEWPKLCRCVVKQHSSSTPTTENIYSKQITKKWRSEQITFLYYIQGIGHFINENWISQGGVYLAKQRQHVVQFVAEFLLWDARWWTAELSEQLPEMHQAKVVILNVLSGIHGATITVDKLAHYIHLESWNHNTKKHYIMAEID